MGQVDVGETGGECDEIAEGWDGQQDQERVLDADEITAGGNGSVAGLNGLVNERNVGADNDVDDALGLRVNSRHDFLLFWQVFDSTRL